MPDKPLQPFAPPATLGLPSGVPTAGTLLGYFFYFALAFWAIYTLIAIYHWLKYSHASAIAIPAIGIHLFVSFVLVSYAISGTLFL